MGEAGQIAAGRCCGESAGLTQQGSASQPGADTGCPEGLIVLAWGSNLCSPGPGEGRLSADYLSVSNWCLQDHKLTIQYNGGVAGVEGRGSLNSLRSLGKMD